MEGRAAFRPVRAWDLPTRLFHWGLVAGLAALVGTATLGRMEAHALAGQSVLSLLVFRVVWGFVGSQTAGFFDFVKGPQTILRHLAQPNSPSIGHNPLGGWMIVALLTVLLAQGLSGLFANDDILFNGPLFHLVGKSTSDLATVFHKSLFRILLGLTAIHVAAVVAHWLVLGDNLVKPMITGVKHIPALHPAPDPILTSTGLAALVLALSVGLVWAVVALA